jgi:hypothetical protein
VTRIASLIIYTLQHAYVESHIHGYYVHHRVSETSCKVSSKGFLFWNPASPELWNLGALKPWKPATLDSWSLVTFEPWSLATLDLQNPGTFDFLPVRNLHWEPSSFIWNFEFWDSHNMDPLVHGILEPGNLECWKYVALGSWNGGTPNLASCNLRALLPCLEPENPVNNFEPCTLWNCRVDAFLWIILLTF